MNRIQRQAEVIQISVYSEIICQILKNHNSGELSVIKVVTFAYIVNRDRFVGNIHTAKVKYDIINRGLSLLAGEFDGYCSSINNILKALHLQIKFGNIILEKNLVKLSEKYVNSHSIYKESNFIKKVIEESKGLTDKQFLKEVLYNV